MNPEEVICWTPTTHHGKLTLTRVCVNCELIPPAALRLTSFIFPFCAAKVFKVEVELSPFLKDMELDIPCFMGLAYCIVLLMLQVGRHGLQGSCRCAPMHPHL